MSEQTTSPKVEPKVAIVTGASRGIGRGIATALGSHGWTVVINYRGNAIAAQESADSVQAAGGRRPDCSG